MRFVLNSRICSVPSQIRGTVGSEQLQIINRSVQYEQNSGKWRKYNEKDLHASPFYVKILQSQKSHMHMSAGGAGRFLLMNCIWQKNQY